MRQTTASHGDAQPRPLETTVDDREGSEEPEPGADSSAESSQPETPQPRPGWEPL